MLNEQHAAVSFHERPPQYLCLISVDISVLKLSLQACTTDSRGRAGPVLARVACCSWKKFFLETAESNSEAGHLQRRRRTCRPCHRG